MYKVFVIFDCITNFFFNWTAVFALIFVNTTIVTAQSDECFVQSDNIATVQFYPECYSLARPIVQMGSSDALRLKFDIIEGDVYTLYYSFSYYNADWTPSVLLDMDYVSGINKFYGNDAYSFSFNTTTDYVHYDISIPTDVLLKSGNYVLNIYSDDAGDKPILRRPFCVYENVVGIDCRTIANTARGRLPYQKIQFLVKYADLPISDPHREIEVRVEQNGRYDNCLTNLKPSFVRQGELVYDDLTTNIFDGANEYRWLDTRSLRLTPQGVQQIDYIDPYYHFTLYANACPQAYSYYSDINGQYVVKAYNINDEDVDKQTDYVFVHFAFNPEKSMLGKDIYVTGALTDWRCTEHNRMIFDASDNMYHLTLRLKQGYYNYQYLFKNSGSQQLSSADNSFEQTENDYYIYVYYRDYASLYDRLVGFRKVNTLEQNKQFIH